MKAPQISIVAAAVLLGACSGDPVDSTFDAVFVDGIGEGLKWVAGHDDNDRKSSAPVASVVVQPEADPVVQNEMRPAEPTESASVVVVPVRAPVVVAIPEPVAEPEPEVIVISNIEEAHAEEDANGHTNSVTDEELVVEMNAFTVEEVAAIIEDETESADFPTFVDFDANIRPGGIGWADSYSIGDRCYIIVTGNGLDHGVGDVVVETPYGEMSVAMVAQTLGQGDGIENADAIYNTVQCGHAPDNGMWDEQPGACPGRVDGLGGGCGELGPVWKFDL